MRPLLAAIGLSLAVPAAAFAQGNGGATPDAPLPRDDGGTSVGEVAPAPQQPKAEVKGERRAKRKRTRRSHSGRPVLSSFSVASKRFYIYGRRAHVRFAIADRSKTVRVRIGLFAPGSRKPVRSFDLGELRTGVQHSFRISGRESGPLPQGDYELRLSARDPGGRTLRRTAQKSGVDRISFHWHRVPLAGPFDWGGEGSRFGAGRDGHSHQGQDLAAAEGTPVVAPRGGVVQHVAYQAEGAGHYVILDGEGEERDYGFMHLRSGSVRVAEGQRVHTGQLLGEVGNTGRSFGAHLHFEVWEGGDWWNGGKPVDPLPYLQRWASWL
jgi:murein DD-endopeptidase MepM/ murein hydrolase activator NlpD